MSLFDPLSRLTFCLWVASEGLSNFHGVIDPVPTEEVVLTVPTQHTDSGLCTLKARMRAQAFQPLTHTYKHKCMRTQRPVGTLAIEQDELRVSYFGSQRGWNEQGLLSGNFGPGSSPCRIFCWGNRRGYVGVHLCLREGPGAGEPPREVAL